MDVMLLLFYQYLYRIICVVIIIDNAGLYSFWIYYLTMSFTNVNNDDDGPTILIYTISASFVTVVSEYQIYVVCVYEELICNF